MKEKYPKKVYIKVLYKINTFKNTLLYIIFCGFMKSNLDDLIFLKVFGDSPRNRVLLFLIDNNEFDYSKYDISKFCGISRVTLDSFIGELIKMELIKKTREIGRATLYKINLANDIVKELIELNELVTNKYSELILEKQKVPA